MKQRLIYIIGVFLLLLSPVLSQAQISYQYWIDDNKEATVSGTTTDGAALSLTIDAAGLTTGVHFLNMRAGENKKWGTVYRKLFAIPRDAQAASSGMKGYEYWIDNDYAHRVSATVSNSTELPVALSIDASELSTGIHFFNMRVQDANGLWGSVKRQVFCIPRDQQAASSNLITGYRYGFGDDLTTVTLGSPVSEYTLIKQLVVPDPPLPVVIDDDCHFSFLGDEATMIRDVEITFALTFTDESNAMSSPIGTTCKLTDTQTSDILTLSVPGSLTIPAHITGGYTVMKFTIETATTYVLTSTTTCSLRLYSSEGAFIKTVKPEQLAIGSLQDLEAGTYYAVAYGNAAETSLSIALETPIVYTVATPVITNDGDVVTITTTTPDATIYYTVDGSIPTAESTLYTEPFTVTENGTIFAIAKRDGYKDSEIALLEVDWIVVGTPCGYAIYDSETSTLTFKYGIMPEGDNVWETDDTGTTAPSWSKSQIQNVVFESSYAQARPTSTYGWFSGLDNLTKITGLEYLNTSQVTDMGYMFNLCSSLTNLDVSNFNTSNVTNMERMFFRCSKLTSLNVSNFNTANVTNMSTMFCSCSGLTSLNLSNFNTSNVTNMGDMFESCSGLTSLNLSNFNTSNVTNMGFMFDGCSSLTILNVSSFNTKNVTNMRWMFYGCNKLTNLNVSNFDTGNVTNMDHMFYKCNSLTGLNVSNFNTANVTNMANMFAYCYVLTSLDVSNFDTSNVTDMGFMFSDCKKLTSLNVSHFNTSKVTDMFCMFQLCESLTSLDVSNFNTAKVTDMECMFNQCKGLKSLNVKNMNTGNVIYMSGMFSDCKGLTSLDLSSFDTHNVKFIGRYINEGRLSTNIGEYVGSGMFSNCSSLKTIYAGKGWSMESVTSDMELFAGCTNLVGGKGTTYNSSHIDKAYARIDGGTSAPGYFTEKTYILGDADGDGTVDVNDVTTTINHILGKPVANFVREAANIDGDESIDVNDVQGIIDIALGKRK